MGSNMIERINWPEQHYGRSDPFTEKEAAELKFTFHDESFTNANASQQNAINILNNLDQLNEINIVQFDKGNLVQIQISENPEADTLRVNLYDPIQERVTLYTGFSKNLVSEASINGLLAQGATGFEGAWNQNYDRLHTEIMCLEAHRALDRHLFVTCSDFFLARSSFFDYTNIFDPLEALRIAGIFLRAKDIWTYTLAHNFSLRISPSKLFFRVIEESIPSYHTYLVAFRKARGIYGIPLSEFGMSIGEKCYRTLQTLDKIADLFYRLQDEKTRDGLLYYFDYLALLLVGAFDSLANVCNVIFGINHKNPSFRHDRFTRKLSLKGGKNIISVVDSAKGEYLQTLLHELRNNIHHVLLPAINIQKIGGPDKVLGRLPELQREKIWDAAEAVGGAESWGLTREDYQTINPTTQLNEPHYDIYLEPYTYARKLTSQWFNMYEDLLQAIDLKNVFKSTNIPKIQLPESGFPSEIENSILLLAL